MGNATNITDVVNSSSDGRSRQSPVIITYYNIYSMLDIRDALVDRDQRVVARMHYRRTGEIFFIPPALQYYRPGLEDEKIYLNVAGNIDEGLYVELSWELFKLRRIPRSELRRVPGGDYKAHYPAVDQTVLERIKSDIPKKGSSTKFKVYQKIREVDDNFREMEDGSSQINMMARVEAVRVTDKKTLEEALEELEWVA